MLQKSDGCRKLREEMREYISIKHINKKRLWNDFWRFFLYPETKCYLSFSQVSTSIHMPTFKKKNCHNLSSHHSLLVTTRLAKTRCKSQLSPPPHTHTRTQTCMCVCVSCYHGDWDTVSEWRREGHTATDTAQIAHFSWKLALKALALRQKRWVKSPKYPYGKNPEIQTNAMM